MGFWRDLFGRRRTQGGDEPVADQPLEDHVLSGPSEIEQLEAAEEAGPPEDRGLTSPPGETW